MEATARRIGAIVAAFLLAIAVVTIQSSPAHATNPTIELDYSSLQVKERTLVYPDTICPNAAPGSDNGYVWGTFTDSDNEVFSNLFIGFSLANGNWASGSFVVPDDASLGAGSLEIYCSHSNSGGSPNRTFDPATVTVVGQSAGVTVDRTNIWHEATFSSVTTCDANVPVDIWLHSQGNLIMSGDLGTTLYDFQITDLVSTDANGMWSWSQNLVPSNGFGNPGYEYTLRAVCQNQAGDFEYGSYNFRLGDSQYVALGDSYSSGLGAFTYNQNACKRSLDSYAFYLADEPGIDPPEHVACQGAVTEDLYSAMTSSGSAPSFSSSARFGQFEWLTPDTGVVTLTIGGNDVGFSPVLSSCADYINHSGFGCINNTTMTSEVMDRIGQLAGYSGSTTAPGGKTIHSYEDVLTEITTRSPSATVYVAGYPRLFGDDTTYWTSDTNVPGSFKCAVYAGTVTFVHVGYNDAMWMNDRVDDINAAIEDAVDAIDSPNVVYVPPTTFDGHGLCDSGTPYVNGVVRDSSGFGYEMESFHPNVDGYNLGYAEAFLDVMN